jgi:penicillin amidase
MLNNPSYVARLYDVASGPPAQSGSVAYAPELQQRSAEAGDSLINVRLVESLQASLQMLRQKFGANPIDWMWGKVHSLELKHPMSSNSLIRRLYDLGPFPRGGNNTTVNNGEFSLDEPYGVLIGPSMRMIVDMSKPGMYFSLPGGECEQLLSPHYSDFLDGYLQGEMKFFPMDLSQDEALHELELIPQ